METISHKHRATKHLRALRHLAGGVVMMLASPIAAANFLVYPLVTSVDVADHADTRISVHSKSPSTQFIRVKVVRLLHPATPDEREEEISATDAKDILVVPRRLVIPPASNRAVRVLVQAAPSEETIYRVYFESVTALDEPTGEPVAGTEAAVSFNIAFGATVRVMPVKKSTHLSLAPSRDALANTGNTRIGVMRVGRCGHKSASDDGCEWTSVERSIYPGKQWPLPWKADERRVVARIRTTDDPKDRDVDVPDSGNHPEGVTNAPP